MRWTAAFLGIAVAVSSSAVPADPRPAGLAGQPSFRDIGSYETEDDRRVPDGLVYRSGELPRLTDKDVERLEELGIKTVVNFLTPEEIEYRGKNRLPPGVREIVIPITGEIGDYLKQGLGVSDQQRRQLQALMTVPLEAKKDAAPNEGSD